MSSSTPRAHDSLAVTGRAFLGPVAGSHGLTEKLQGKRRRKMLEEVEALLPIAPSLCSFNSGQLC